MKKYAIILTLAFIVGVNTMYAQQQQLLENLVGKWNVKEYHNNKEIAIDTGFIDFRQNGVFESGGTYFGTRKGLYRTDETRSVVLIDDGKTTEWKAKIASNVLQMDRILKKERNQKKQKKQKIYIILVKEGKDENQQVRSNN